MDANLPASQAITTRRSTRSYTTQPMTKSELLQLLFLTTGISAERWRDEPASRSTSASSPP